jgi:alkanesulfonate monooxygenase SsuD/methylene tetrahydromethanopterin reductase-like flavin-dependent oxidoreductase (luciferase family)
MRERVEAIKQIWAEEQASYDGEMVSFEAIESWPKPVQTPHPPVLVGGNGPRVLDRVLGFGDAWFPGLQNTTAEDDAVMLERIAELHARAERPIGVSLAGAPEEPSRLARYADAGVERAAFHLPSAARDELERRLDDLQPMIDRFA